MAMPADDQSLLQPLEHLDKERASPPSKCITTEKDLGQFKRSVAYERIVRCITVLNESVKQRSWREGDAKSTRIDSLLIMLQQLSDWIDEIPPQEGPRRFGNPAYRQWVDRLESTSETKVRDLLGDELQAYTVELAPYLVGAFGSKQRLDYGTGHELSFLAFICGLFFVGYFHSKQDAVPVALLVIPAYLDVVRKLVCQYTLEPAGSHGVWGLDDHSFIPYILGSSQLSELHDAPPPTSVLDKSVVDREKSKNLYFDAIAFINSVKKGPFFEHSPVLYDISGVPSWHKVNQGMQKMYVAEVLHKFPVVQHFPFGALLFPFESSRTMNPPSSVPPRHETSHGHSKTDIANQEAEARNPSLASTDQVAPPKADEVKTGMTTKAPWAT